MRTITLLVVLAVALGAAVVAVPTANAAHCGLDVRCMAENYGECLHDALERHPPQFWCEA